ncbi:ABC transporter substrate-binding protein [Peptoniphilus sp. KCTC 25270]|uniref:ABC transporter substrate-binding protein n=1 Tax=Peptoniphilus sp. KCTC 25270 TaxID=2897414 RepID=UPI001E300D63|nr:ABC transporter substrate-binding protein [Peptoniphilus sp. KCTC 25270]MCD1147394.1 ABC transporter substrate-binding protein [Peptoniphilus sp. KCTC 25270]
MKKTKLIAALLAITLLATACGAGGNNSANTGDNTASAGEGSGKDTLTIAMQEDATTLDPVLQNSIYAENVVRQIFDTLLVRLPDGTMENRLAESIEQTDDLTYVVTLKPDVKFSNGEDLTSEDVQFTLERAAESDSYAYIFEKIDPASYDSSDPLKLTFKLKEADGSFLNALSHPAVSIVDKKTVEEAGDAFEQNPVGTGPFVLDNWTKLDSVTLSRNENYWGEAPAFSTMVFRIIPESNNRMIELESGQVDLALEIAPNDIAKIEENENLALHRKLDNSIHFMGMDVTHAPFDKIEAREALNYALDMQAIVDSVYMGVGKVATGPINPNFDYSISDELQPFARDTAKAKELFAQAGINEGDTLKLYTSQDQARKDMATIIQSQLSEIGINVEITSLEWGAFVDALENHEHNMFIMSWTPSIVDPHYTLFSPYHSKNAGVGPNYMFYANPEVDALIEKGIQVTGDSERAAVYKEVQELLMKELPTVSALYGEQVIGTQSNVQGFEIDPSGSNEYYHIQFQ